MHARLILRINGLGLRSRGYRIFIMRASFRLFLANFDARFRFGPEGRFCVARAIVCEDLVREILFDR